MVKELGAQPRPKMVIRLKHAAYHGEILMLSPGHEPVHVPLLSGAIKLEYLHERETSSMVSQDDCETEVNTRPHAHDSFHCHSWEAEALCIETAPEQSIVVAFLADRNMDVHGTYPLYCPKHGEWDLRDAKAARVRSSEADLAGEASTTWVTPLYANAHWVRGEETYTEVVRLLLDTTPDLCNAIYQGFTPLATTYIGNSSGAAQRLQEADSSESKDK